MFGIERLLEKGLWLSLREWRLERIGCEVVRRHSRVTRRGIRFNRLVASARQDCSAIILGFGLFEGVTDTESRARRLLLDSRERTKRRVGG